MWWKKLKRGCKRANTSIIASNMPIIDTRSVGIPPRMMFLQKDHVQHWAPMSPHAEPFIVKLKESSTYLMNKESCQKLYKSWHYLPSSVTINSIEDNAKRVIIFFRCGDCKTVLVACKHQWHGVDKQVAGIVTFAKVARQICFMLSDMHAEESR